MMKNIFFLGLGLMLAACHAAPPIRINTPCTVAPHITVTLHVPTKTVKPIAPPNFCATPGQTFKVNIVPAAVSVPTGSAMLIAKSDNPDGGGPNNWLTQINTLANQVTVTAPPATYFSGKCNLGNEDCQFRYGIYIKGYTAVDPRVTVKN